MICVRKNTLSQVYLHVSILNSDAHIASHYKVWWFVKHGDYLQGVQHLINCFTPFHIKSKTTQKIENNFGSGSQKICSNETEERLEEKIE